MARGSPFLLCLGRHSEEAGDEGDLPADVSFAHPLHLPLANHMHRFIALQGSPCRFHGKEAHPGLDQPFEKAVVLLHQVLEVFDLPEFDRRGKHSDGFERGLGLGIGGVLIHIDHARSRRGGVGRSRGLGHLFLGRMGPRN